MIISYYGITNDGTIIPRLFYIYNIKNKYTTITTKQRQFGPYQTISTNKVLTSSLNINQIRKIACIHAQRAY